MSNALELFNQIPRPYNCAQTIAAGFEATDLIPEFATMGGGRAPQGLCGALYAATQLAPEAKRSQLIQDFTARLGASTCKELKARGIPCARCVETAEALLNELKTH